MSEETAEDLNTNTLIGNTDERGHAWHYRAELQGDEPNHYAGPIPVADVKRRLFDWEAQSVRVAVERPVGFNGRKGKGWEVQNDRQAIARSDTGAVLGLFKDGYEPHQYDEWLLNQVANILDDMLCISSAGLLRGGAVAWVEVSVPHSVVTPEGVTFRPNLLATTSFDGSIATTYKRTITDVVCDNTRAAALSENSPTYKVKHSKYSGAALLEVRDALEIVYELADEFSAEVARLCDTEVSDRQWTRFLDTYVPIPVERDGIKPPTRVVKTAERKQEALKMLWTTDDRVTPWAGTAHGVVQAVNTWEHHMKNVRGNRGERNMLRALNGDFDNLDGDVLGLLGKVMELV